MLSYIGRATMSTFAALEMLFGFTAVLKERSWFIFTIISHVPSRLRTRQLPRVRDHLQKCLDFRPELLETCDWIFVLDVQNRRTNAFDITFESRDF